MAIITDTSSSSEAATTAGNHGGGRSGATRGDNSVGVAATTSQLLDIHGKPVSVSLLSLSPEERQELMKADQIRRDAAYLAAQKLSCPKPAKKTELKRETTKTKPEKKSEPQSESQLEKYKFYQACVKFLETDVRQISLKKFESVLPNFNALKEYETDSEREITIQSKLIADLREKILSVLKTPSMMFINSFLANKNNARSKYIDVFKAVFLEDVESMGVLNTISSIINRQISQINNSDSRFSLRLFYLMLLKKVSEDPAIKEVLDQSEFLKKDKLVNYNVEDLQLSVSRVATLNGVYNNLAETYGLCRKTLKSTHTNKQRTQVSRATEAAPRPPRKQAVVKVKTIIFEGFEDFQHVDPASKQFINGDTIKEEDSFKACENFLKKNEQINFEDLSSLERNLRVLFTKKPSASAHSERKASFIQPKQELLKAICKKLINIIENQAESLVVGRIGDGSTYADIGRVVQTIRNTLIFANATNEKDNYISLHKKLYSELDQAYVKSLERLSGSLNSLEERRKYLATLCAYLGQACFELEHSRRSSIDNIDEGLLIKIKEFGDEPELSNMIEKATKLYQTLRPVKSQDAQAA